MRVDLLALASLAAPPSREAGTFVEAERVSLPPVALLDPSDPASDLPPTLPTQPTIDLPLPARGGPPRNLVYAEYFPPAPAPAPGLIAAPEPEPTPPPSWLVAWKGTSPELAPTRAYELSRKDPEAYADWLRSYLPPGCTVRRELATVTAYCPCEICCNERTGRTATGRLTDLHPYGVAADFRSMKRGTKLHIPGYLTQSTVGGVWEVDDTGGALRRSRERGTLHLDVRFVSHSWAERWGTRRMWVYVITGPVEAQQ